MVLFVFGNSKSKPRPIKTKKGNISLFTCIAKNAYLLIMLLFSFIMEVKISLIGESLGHSASVKVKKKSLLEKLHENINIVYSFYILHV
jgi:hypothetical protein